MIDYGRKLDIISSRVEDAEKVVETKKQTQQKIVEMIKKQEAAEKQFSLRNLKSDPVYQKAVSQGNHKLIQKFIDRTLTEKEYDLESRYDTVRSVVCGNGYKYVTKQGKVGLVNGDNEEVFEPIYDEMYANIPTGQDTTDGITWAVKGDELIYFDSCKQFQRIDLTGFEPTGRTGSGGYWLRKIKGKRGKKTVYEEKLYLLSRDIDTHEITITKTDKTEEILRNESI